ncbi:MAG: SDR family NAD(P)-dependent oxidoreductase [Eubacteriales bacterium]|nr:SDR family NAD(P)-dependent oxidoreductase [Eubacteriales bacterium]
MRIAIITGATSGMGREMAKIVLSKEKDFDEIWLIGRRENRLKVFERADKKKIVRLFPIDLLDNGQMKIFYEQLRDENPEIALFIHAAGVGKMGAIEEISVEEAEQMVDLNVRSYVSLTGHLLPYMEKRGRMIFFASAAAFLPQPGFAVYAASKAFVLSFVRSLRAEQGYRHLRITAVCPGAVDTEFLDHAASEQEIPFYKKMVMAKADQVAKKAWKDNLSGKELSVYGPFMKGFALFTKIIPHRFILHFMGTRGDKE